MPWLGHSFTCLGWDVVKRHALVGRQLFDIPWSGRGFITYMGREAVIQHALIGMQFYDIPCSGHSFTAYPGQDAVIQHALIGMQVYLSWLGHSFTCSGGDAIVRHVLVGTHLFNMSWWRSSLTTCLEETPFLWVVGHYGLGRFRTKTFRTCHFGLCRFGLSFFQSRTLFRIYYPNKALYQRQTQTNLHLLCCYCSRWSQTQFQSLVGHYNTLNAYKSSVLGFLASFSLWG